MTDAGAYWCVDAIGSRFLQIIRRACCFACLLVHILIWVETEMFAKAVLVRDKMLLCPKFGVSPRYSSGLTKTNGAVDHFFSRNQPGVAMLFWLLTWVFLHEDHGGCLVNTIICSNKTASVTVGIILTIVVVIVQQTKIGIAWDGAWLSILFSFAVNKAQASC